MKEKEICTGLMEGFIWEDGGILCFREEGHIFGIMEMYFMGFLKMVRRKEKEN